MDNMNNPSDELNITGIDNYNSFFRGTLSVSIAISCPLHPLCSLMVTLVHGFLITIITLITLTDVDGSLPDISHWDVSGNPNITPSVITPLVSPLAFMA